MFFRRLIILFLSVLCTMAAEAKKAPPELLPLDGKQSRIRIPLGTKQFVLTCPVKVGEEAEAEDGEEAETELMIKWSKNGETIVADRSDQLRVLNRDLRIRSPQLADSGRYRCTAINEWGHRMVDFLLEVFDPATNRGVDFHRDDGGGELALSEDVSAPKWRDAESMTTKHIRLASGSALHLRCPPSSGNPLPQVVWTRDDVLPISLELTNPNAASFSLDRVRPQDSARYSCLVQNQLGSIRADFHVLITSASPSDDSTSSADQILFGSSASGAFSPQHSSASVLPLPPTPRIDHPQNEQNASFSAVRVGHIAQLLCRVEWRREKSVIRWLRKLDNSEAARARRVPNATILRIGGEMALLVLDQQGSDAVRVEMDAAGQRQFVNELRIPNVRKEDAGRYFCVVTNPTGQFVYRSALLRVLDPPPPSAFFPPLPTSSSAPFLLLFLFFPVLFLLLLFLWLCRRFSSASARLPRPHPSSTAHPNNISSVASNTFASLSSSAASFGDVLRPLPPSAKLPNNFILFPSSAVPPPPPRMPPPLLPPSASFAAPIQWPTKATTLERRRAEVRSPPHALHRTAAGGGRAEDEMSRMSSHIYASGSPLPPPAPVRLPPPPLSSPLPSPRVAQLPPSPAGGGRRIGGGGKGIMKRRENKAEEQRMPLIEAQRQSAEFWIGGGCH